MRPYEAALKGSGEIAFTILSISISLVAVFIPLLLLGGIIGRLFREFAVTTTMCIGVSAFVALTLTPMMAARFLRNERQAKHGRFYASHRARLRAPARRLRARPRCRAAPPVRDAVRVPGHRGADRLPVRQHPEGLLSAAGHRPDHRHVRGGAGRLVRRDDAPAGGARRDHRQGSGRCHLCHGAGRRRLQPDHQQRPLLHHAQAQERARRVGLRGDRQAAAAAREGGGRAALHAGRAGRQRRRPGLAHAVPVHAAGRQPRRALGVGAQGAREAEVPADAARRGVRPADLGRRADARPSTATRRPATASPRS